MTAPTIIILIICAVLTMYVPKLPGIVLKRKFHKLDRYEGKSYQEIAAAVGKENTKKDLAGANGIGFIEREWQAAMYRVSLKFSKEDDICLGLIKELEIGSRPRRR